MYSAPFITSLLNQIQLKSPQVLSLVPGQIVLGEVEQIMPDQSAIIRIGHLRLHAKQDTALEAGQRSWFQVQSQTNPITLKMLPLPVQKQTSEGNVDSLLKYFGIKKNSANEQVIRFFLQEKLPITKSTLQTIQQVMGSVRVPIEEILKASQTAILKGIPISKSSLVALRSFLFSPPVHHQVESLLPLLANEQQKQIISVLPQLNESQLHDKKMIQDFFRSMGFESEKNLIALFNNVISTKVSNTNPFISENLHQSQTQANSQILTQTQNQTQIQNQTQTQTNALHHVLDQAQSQNQKEVQAIQKEVQPQKQTEGQTIQKETPSMIQKDAQTINQTQNQSQNYDLSINRQEMVGANLKQTLQQILQDSQVSSQLKERVEGIVQHITGQQFFFLGDQNQSPMYQILFQLAVQFNGQQNAIYGQLEGKKDQQGHIDADNCRVIFYLQLQSLGETGIDVQILNKNVSISLYNEKKHSEWLNELKPGLQSTLKSLGYSLTNFVWKEKEKNSAFSSGTKNRNNPYSVQAYYQGVDVRI